MTEPTDRERRTDAEGTNGSGESITRTFPVRRFRPHTGLTLRSLAQLALLAIVVAGCNDAAPPRDLTELVVVDSTYYAPERMVPYSGRVFRAFPGDSKRMQIEGALLDGTWHGELRVYHRSGRVRYMGSFSRGERCGPWTENAWDREPVNLYDEFVSEVEAMAIYPPCPSGLRTPHE